MTPEERSARILALEQRDELLRAERVKIGDELDRLYVDNEADAARVRSLARSQPKHVWRAISEDRKTFRCARCGVTKRVYGNGSGYYRPLGGKATKSNPECVGAST